MEYRSANIPEGFDGYRIVQISDIHIGSWQGNPEPIKQLVDLVNGQKPDLIVFTGDLVNQQSHELDGFQEILSQLYAPDGVYSILGNHDYGSYYHWQSPKAEIANLDYLIRQQKAMGWKLLNNEHDILHHKGDSIALIGVETTGSLLSPNLQTCRKPCRARRECSKYCSAITLPTGGARYCPNRIFH